jgi:hypothetical protein
MMARFQPSTEPLRRERNSIGPDDANGIEAERPGALHEGPLQGFPVFHRCRMIRANNRFPLVLIML